MAIYVEELSSASFSPDFPTVVAQGNRQSNLRDEGSNRQLPERFQISHRVAWEPSSSQDIYPLRQAVFDRLCVRGYFERGGESFILMYGAWMPDMNNPQPPPDGFLLDEVSRLVENNGKYVIEDREYEIAITDRIITFGLNGVGQTISARAPQINGVIERVR